MLSTLVVQRAAQVDRGAAGARRLHDGHHRARQDPRHRPVAVAGLRVPHHLVEDRRRAPALHRRRGGHHRARRRAAGAGAGRRGQHARLAQRLRPGARLRRRHADHRRRHRGARAGRPRPRLRRARRGGRGGRGGGVRAGRNRHRARLRPAHPVPRAGPGDARPRRRSAKITRPRSLRSRGSLARLTRDRERRTRARARRNRSRRRRRCRPRPSPACRSSSAVPGRAGTSRRSRCACAR